MPLGTSRYNAKSSVVSALLVGCVDGQTPPSFVGSHSTTPQHLCLRVFQLLAVRTNLGGQEQGVQCDLVAVVRQLAPPPISSFSFPLPATHAVVAPACCSALPASPRVDACFPLPRCCCRMQRWQGALLERGHGVARPYLLRSWQRLRQGLRSVQSGQCSLLCCCPLPGPGPRQCSAHTARTVPPTAAKPRCAHAAHSAALLA